MELRPSASSWGWQQAVVVDGEEYLANRIQTVSPEFDAFWAIRGIPERFVEPLLRAAHVDNDNPHGWKIRNHARLEDVTAEDLQLARQCFDHDMNELRSMSIIYLAQTGEDLRVMGGGLVQTQLSPSYESKHFAILCRLVGLPEYRGKGLARYFNAHFWMASQTLPGFPLIGLFFPTETAQTKKLVARAGQELGFEFARLGRITHHMPQGINYYPTMYAGLYPGMHAFVAGELAALRSTPRWAALSPSARSLLDRVESFLARGDAVDSPARLHEEFERDGDELDAAAAADPRVSFLCDFTRCLYHLGVVAGVVGEPIAA